MVILTLLKGTPTDIIFTESRSYFFSRSGLDCKRQEKLAKSRLAYRKGRKVQKEIFDEDFKLIENETGLVDIHENIIKALEKKHMTEREFLVYMLQGRDSAHARSAARKLSPGSCMGPIKLD